MSGTWPALVPLVAGAVAYGRAAGCGLAASGGRGGVRRRPWRGWPACSPP
ncbi:hypothetical protein [Actinopolymorpha cephalotaxi]|uniref:Uncharacterized protein n=1 Tax=Actinopolymorpha cephalotaxi TaxID=504797 RepID=A0ABX2S6F5_9ACTN|nr:hypothetical protein [Actinopolymorpha cephalotaxi]NYH84889.1 hypothetical protein [Actinopolymorpha cephalotaxi]